MDSFKLRQSFLDFFKSKGHIILPGSSLIPADGTSLFTTAGVQQFNKYLTGKEVSPYKRVATSQLCFRTDDIEEIGDNRHLSLFEMLGNWSFGDYFKKEAIDFAYEYLTSVLGLDNERIWITYFGGDAEIPEDVEAKTLWERYVPVARIVPTGRKDNFWGPIGDEGPCGPCSEIHYDFSRKPCPDNCKPNCGCNRFIEIWNLVFTQYNKGKDGKLTILPKKNIDTGIGFERLAIAVNGKKNVFECDLFAPLMMCIAKEIAADRTQDALIEKYKCILADHIRSISFVLCEGVTPSNVAQGYILRRLIRRFIRTQGQLGLDENFIFKLFEVFFDNYKQSFPVLVQKKDLIISEIEKEKEKFSKALFRGNREIKRILAHKKIGEGISGKETFDLYQSYGFPLELTREIAKENGFSVDVNGFQKFLKEHQDISRKGAEKKFGGHGMKLENSQETDKGVLNKKVRLHTATHLLQAALRKVLGEEVHQMGSDINDERLRFDFSFARKMANGEKEKVEDLVNQAIKEGLEVKRENMPLSQALSQGALAFFKEKYPENVSVYTIFNPKTGEVFSKEICGGPHAQNTKEIGSFKISKEESSSAGVRRIKAIVL